MCQGSLALRRGLTRSRSGAGGRAAQFLRSWTQAAPSCPLSACRTAAQMPEPAWEAKSGLMDEVTCGMNTASVSMPA